MIPFFAVGPDACKPQQLGMLVSGYRREDAGDVEVLTVLSANPGFAITCSTSRTVRYTHRHNQPPLHKVGHGAGRPPCVGAHDLSIRLNYWPTS